MVMGSITGSAAANTATTGSFTIPMMKDQGIRKDFAAAIESVASTGGQMLPPVMGVAAFLMADMLGISYVRVIQAGILLQRCSTSASSSLSIQCYSNTDGRSPTPENSTRVSSCPVFTFWFR